jgi:hypothetical protein
MPICIEIEIDDNGHISVGQCPPDENTAGEEQGEKQYMMPAASIGEAIKTAAALLASGGNAQPTSSAQPASVSGGPGMVQAR